MCFHPFPPFSFSVGEWNESGLANGIIFSFISPAFSLALLVVISRAESLYSATRGSFGSRTFHGLFPSPPLSPVLFFPSLWLWLWFICTPLNVCIIIVGSIGRSCLGFSRRIPVSIQVPGTPGAVAVCILSSLSHGLMGIFLGIRWLYVVLL